MHQSLPKVFEPRPGEIRDQPVRVTQRPVPPVLILIRKSPVVAPLPEDTTSRARATSHARALFVLHEYARLQAAWDAENAVEPMPVRRPSAATIIGGGLLVALVLILIWGL